MFPNCVACRMANTDKSESGFKNCQYSDRVLRRLNEMRKNSELCDIILIAGDQKFNAHKNILSISSLYFLAMFSGNFPEIEKKEIVLKDVDPEGLELILEYIYTAHLVINNRNVQSLMILSSFLQIDWIEERCCDYIVKELDLSNCLELKRFGDTHLYSQLVDIVNRYILRHFQELCKCEEFLTLSFEEIESILNSSEPYMYDEEIFLRSIVKWAEHDLAERQQHVSKLINRLHPACVTIDTVRSFPILQEDKECSKWVDNINKFADKWQWNLFVLDKMGRDPDFIKYDLTSGTMSYLCPLPVPVFAQSLASSKHFLYVQGGSRTVSQPTCYFYNVYKNKWVHITPMREARSHHRSLIKDNFMYAIGGNGPNGSLRSVECMDLERGSTLSIEPMISSRNSMGAAVYAQCLYVMGGEKDHKSLSSVERYDPRVGAWQSVPKLNFVNSYCTSAATDDYLYCSEGLGRSMERFDCRRMKWEIIDFGADMEFFELLSIGNDLYSISSMEITVYDSNRKRWQNIFYYPQLRDWDTAVAMELVDDTSMCF